MNAAEFHEEFRRAIEADPRNWVAWLRLARELFAASPAGMVRVELHQGDVVEQRLRFGYANHCESPRNFGHQKIGHQSAGIDGRC